MITRYPHTGKIVVATEVDNADGISTSTKVETILQGRFEPNSQQKTLDYSAKFYCKNFGANVFQYDGQNFVFNGKQFKIVQLFPYQTHCEIWLE
ncbi:hypothetical protein [Changchengzhania lutea]|uniref:hypothetical protein n=1 Tax=Changchengzhania lutea TaxID=2049305 RepID=UPI00115EE4E3|nr:hypothetical protein [Changchengzhania lutea]